MRDIIHSLTTMYSTICRAKGIVPDITLQKIATGAHGMTEATVAIADHTPAYERSSIDRKLLEEAKKIDDQIEEITVFLLSMEIV